MMMSGLRDRFSKLMIAFKIKYYNSMIAAHQYSASTRMHKKRAGWYRHLMKEIGEDCYMKSGVVIEYPQNVSIGNRVSIQHNCFISGYGNIQIGSDVSIGNDTKIISSEHPYTGTVFRNDKLIPKPVHIGNNVIIGTTAVILGGVRIGDNVMIGAGAIVTKDIPGNGIYAGNPAKLIKEI